MANRDVPSCIQTHLLNNGYVILRRTSDNWLVLEINSVYCDRLYVCEKVVDEVIMFWFLWKKDNLIQLNLTIMKG